MRGSEKPSIRISDPLTPALSLRERGPGGTAVGWGPTDPGLKPVRLRGIAYSLSILSLTIPRTPGCSLPDVIVPTAPADGERH